MAGSQQNQTTGYVKGAGGAGQQAQHRGGGGNWGWVSGAVKWVGLPIGVVASLLYLGQCTANTAVDVADRTVDKLGDAVVRDGTQVVDGTVKAVVGGLETAAQKTVYGYDATVKGTADNLEKKDRDEDGDLERGGVFGLADKVVESYSGEPKGVDLRETTVLYNDFLSQLGSYMDSTDPINPRYRLEISSGGKRLKLEAPRRTKQERKAGVEKLEDLVLVEIEELLEPGDEGKKLRIVDYALSPERDLVAVTLGEEKDQFGRVYLGFVKESGEHDYQVAWIPVATNFGLEKVGRYEGGIVVAGRKTIATIALTSGKPVEYSTAPERFDMKPTKK